MLQRGRGLFYVLATGLIAVVLVTVSRLPPMVASHFDAAGVPNGWSSRPAYALLLIAIGVLLPLGIIRLIISLTRRGPARLNIPARDHWTRPEHSEEAVLRVRGLRMVARVHHGWDGSLDTLVGGGRPRPSAAPAADQRSTPGSRHSPIRARWVDGWLVSDAAAAAFRLIGTKVGARAALRACSCACR